MGFNLLYYVPYSSHCQKHISHENETIEEVEPPLTIAEFSVALNLRVFADRSCSPIDKEKSASAIPNPATQHRRTLQ
jgi:hypothetical protein